MVKGNAGEKQDADFVLISSYTREQALDDGVLVDVSGKAVPLGIKFPIAVTRTVWDTYIAVPEELKGMQDELGRLHDLLWMFRNAALRTDGDTLTFETIFQMPDKGDWRPNERIDRELGRKARLVTLKAVCGPGDNMEPVVTISLPEED